MPAFCAGPYAALQSARSPSAAPRKWEKGRGGSGSALWYVSLVDRLQCEMLFVLTGVIVLLVQKLAVAVRRTSCTCRYVRVQVTWAVPDCDD